MSSTYELRKRLIAIANKELGVTEIGDSNTGPRVLEYQRATWLDGTGWPWCAAFQCWIIREWLKDKDVLDAFKFTAAQAEEWRPKTAGAWDFERWGREKGLLVVADADQPDFVLHTADIVTFRYSHIEMISNDSGESLLSIGGNTDDGLGRDGGAVCEHWHPRNTARRYIRLLA
ncbi:MAG: hypothetical protein WCL08_00300 [Verrucomicrobiota bacterium]